MDHVADPHPGNLLFCPTVSSSTLTHMVSQYQREQDTSRRQSLYTSLSPTAASPTKTEPGPLSPVDRSQAGEMVPGLLDFGMCIRYVHDTALLPRGTDSLCAASRNTVDCSSVASSYCCWKETKRKPSPQTATLSLDYCSSWAMKPIKPIERRRETWSSLNISFEMRRYVYRQ